MSCRPMPTSIPPSPTPRTRWCSREPRALFRRLLEQGWVDAIRTMHPDAPMYTFWDYKRNRWQRDAGLRIDHLLLNPKAAKRLVEAGVDREVRGLEGASDHAPAWIVLSDKPTIRRKAVRQSKTAPSRPDEWKPRSERGAGFAAGRCSSSTAIYLPIAPITRLPKTILGRGRKPAGAILGFANLLLRLYREEQPRAVLVAWDTLEVPTYRHEKFPAYQSGREFDDALLEQLEALPEFVAACGFQNAKAPGFEADDFLAAAAAKEEKRGGTVLIASGDRDTLPARLRSHHYPLPRPRRRDGTHRSRRSSRAIWRRSRRRFRILSPCAAILRTSCQALQA